MKLTLIFLLVCAVVTCSQLRQSKKLPWTMLSLSMPYYSPRAFYKMQANPYYYLDGTESIDPSSDSSSISEYDEEASDHDNGFLQAQSRTPGRIWPSTSNRIQPQNRLFFNAFNPFFSTNFTPFWLSASSTLTTVTVSSTILTAVVTTCIPAAQFVAGSSNVVCARRKRDVLEEAYRSGNSEQLSPTLVQGLETTPIPDIVKNRRHVDFVNPIVSSIEDEAGSSSDVVQPVSIYERQPRAATITYTTTTTSIVYSSTIIKKTLNLVTGSVLNCLPSGFVVC